ncbi:MAG: hypothetical protein KGD66_04495 [Candidatus Lokiarchaeota archaeon]|nr:hypothetical protein [Candidatus Lokiarchaeota archaeon]
MRKRTQLVGFEFGYWKHSQYITEFLDNSLDAIETFHWKEIEKSDSRNKFSLDQETALENLSLMQDLLEEETFDSDDKEELSKEKEEEAGEIIDKAEIEVEEEVQRIIDDLEELLKPIEDLVDIEPIVVVRLRESEPPSFLTSELSQKNVMNYTIEIFDNGIGMSKGDLRKFGKYLASSKSVELKQTRGSQGFGAPSAFSDAQNTTGKPIIVASKTSDMVYANTSEFFTTSKNEKRYLIHPVDFDSPFGHGTYIKLNYLNVKYVRGYVDTYINETALMNPHITILFIDPYGEQITYPRLVSSFPKQPKYAKPHPSSTNIGDLQDLIAKSENLTVSAFLQENFVRVSPKTAKEIIIIAEKDLQNKNNLLILKEGFITKSKKKEDPIYLLKKEKRVYGRSEKLRDKIIIYSLKSDDLKNDYWTLISEFINKDKNLISINKSINKHNRRIETVNTKKEQKNIEKEVDKLVKEINKINKQNEEIKNQIYELIKRNESGLLELKKFPSRTEYEDLIREVQISKAKPVELSNEQFNSLFHAFKSIKYMGPPTDTAIPVGDRVLENTLVKEIGLKISENIEDFDDPVSNLVSVKETLLKEKKKQESLSSEDAPLDRSVNNSEIEISVSRILASYDILENNGDPDEFNNTFNKVFKKLDDESGSSYRDLLNYFIDIHSKDDDFASAETRPPTSGKGLAYVVEAALAYCNDPKKLDTPKRSRDVLSRFVNRTPKLRDSAECAITKAVQSVNWKNYKLDTFDNNLPKGPIKLLVNVSGPYVHLMFKSQSKNALAEDEELIKEIKYCLEAIGRRLRAYLNKKDTFRKTEKRSSVIERYIPTFVESLFNIAKTTESEYKEKSSPEELERLMKEAIGKKTTLKLIVEQRTEKPVIQKEGERKEIPKKVEIEWEKEVEEAVDEKSRTEDHKPETETFSEKTLLKWTIKELLEYSKEFDISISPNSKKIDIINKIQSYKKTEAMVEKPTIEVEEELVKLISKRPESLENYVTSKESKPIKETPPKPKPKGIIPQTIQTTLPVITTDKIIATLNNEWQNITHLIFKLKIKDMMDARYLQNRLKELVRREKVEMLIIKNKKHWKLK